MNETLPQKRAERSLYADISLQSVPPKHYLYVWVSVKYSSYPCLCEAEQTALEYLGQAFSENFIHNDYMFFLTGSLW